MYDAFFISFDEPYADNAFAILQHNHPIVRRVHGIAGIQNAHRECARQSRTEHFFVIDADNRIHDPSVFDFLVSSYDRGYVHLWYARNPVNGLAYGWGGLKLFPRKVFTDDAMPLDMTTSFPLKIIPEIISTSEFNVSPLDTWRSAFRETVKLTVGEQNRETRERLYGWCEVARGPFAEYCLKGARAGVAYAEGHRDDRDALLRINDYEWLRERFLQAM